MLKKPSTINKKRFSALIVGLIICLTSCEQKTELQKIDSLLVNSFKAMVSADYQLQSSSLAPAFKAQLLSHLINPITFDNELDSLSKYMTIKTSPDKKIKFYSWDDRSGGSWSHIHCVAQFRSDNGRTIVQQISSENAAETDEYTDSGIYDVFEFNEDNEKLYLTFAWGTHGSGHQHQIVQIFQIVGDTLLKCRSCFADTNVLVVEYPRMEKIDLTFDPVNNQIKYNEFKSNEIGLNESTGKTITLELINGVFTRI